MNKIARPLIQVLLVLATLAPSVQAEVLLSELCDPRNDYLTDRYIEIFNPGPDAVNLTGWKIVAVGNSSEIFTWNLSGTINSGQALVAGDQTTADMFPVDFPEEAWSNNNATWNGKVGDGARLKNASGAVIDDAVVPGTNFENQTMVRNENVSVPNGAYVLAEWTATPVDTPSEASPGSHHVAATDGPAISGTVTVPEAPLPGQPVQVQANVADAEANITSVTLEWGVFSGALINSITMANTSGDTYVTNSSIPGQPDGTTVYYAVTATSDLPAETTTVEMFYYLDSGTYPPGYYNAAAGLEGASTTWA